MQILQNKVKHQASEVLDFSSLMSQDLVPTRHGPVKDQPGFSQSLQIPGTAGLGLGKDSMRAPGSSFLPRSARRWQPGSEAIVLMDLRFPVPLGNIRALRAVEDHNSSSALNRCSALYNMCVHIHICTHRIQKGHTHPYTQGRIDCSEN